MNLFNTLKETVEGTGSHKVKSHKSLKAIMEAVDFHVFRYRKKTGVTYLGARGGKYDQRQYMDSMVISLPGGFKIYALNIDQFAQKCNDSIKEVSLAGGKKGTNVIPGNGSFPLSKLPIEIVKDLGAKQSSTSGQIKRVFNKAGYAAWIEKDGKIEGLRKTKYEGIKLESTPSKKMIYRRYRDGSLEESFIKVLGAYIISTVTNKKGETLLDIDIDPKDYTPKKENTEKGESKATSLPKESTLNLDEPILKKTNSKKIKSLGIELVDMNLPKEKLHEYTKGTGGLGTIISPYDDLYQNLGEAIYSSESNFPGDDSKAFMQWIIKCKKGVITIYDYSDPVITEMKMKGKDSKEDYREAITSIQMDPLTMYGVGGSVTKEEAVEVLKALGVKMD